MYLKSGSRVRNRPATESASKAFRDGLRNCVQKWSLGCLDLLRESTMKKGLAFFGLSLLLAAFGAPGEGVVAQSPVFRARTDLVYLPVTVTDRKGRLIKGLEANQFRVYEEGIEQQISYFGGEQTPVLVGLVLDRSGSMMMMLEDVYSAALHVLDNLNQPADGAFAMTFNNEVLLVQPMTHDLGSLRAALRGLEAEGATALYDAIAKALDYLVEGAEVRHQRKALCVISDGEDNASATDYPDLLRKAEEADVTIYSVAMVERIRFFDFLFSGSHKAVRRLAEATGGKYHRPSSIEECERAMKVINEELRSQYALGYYPPRPEGRSWRRVKVGVTDGKRKFVARTRQGYFR